MERPDKNWHDKELDTRTAGDKLSDFVAENLGSWRFIGIQTVIVVLWIIVNLTAYAFRWDPYPFILLNLLFSTQASYAAPIIMMAQNRQADRDRAQAAADYETNISAKQEIEQLQESLARIENDKLDKIITMLQSEKDARK